MLEILAKEWVKLFKLRPYLTSFLTIVLAAILAVTIIYFEQLDREKREYKRLENLNYQSQINELNDTESSIRQLLEFVQFQKTTLQETEDTISLLKTEKERLQPLVESDRTVVEAIFKAQEERTSTTVWRERWIGFGFGILASLIASFIWFVFAILVKRKA
jgi:sensor c-di-GMP phosphodiesterase-like protein